MFDVLLKILDHCDKLLEQELLERGVGVSKNNYDSVMREQFTPSPQKPEDFSGIPSDIAGMTKFSERFFSDLPLPELIETLKDAANLRLGAGGRTLLHNKTKGLPVMLCSSPATAALIKAVLGRLSSIRSDLRIVYDSFDELVMYPCVDKDGDSRETTPRSWKHEWVGQ